MSTDTGGALVDAAHELLCAAEKVIEHYASYIRDDGLGVEPGSADLRAAIQ